MAKEEQRPEGPVQEQVAQILTQGFRNIVLCDIDHTIANSFWRDGMIGGEGGWDAYHAASKDDKPIIEVARMVWGLKATGFQVMGLTARPAKWRKLTMDWLLRHNIQLDDILMRPDTAYHPAPEIKVNLVKERFELEEIAMILDDRDDVVAAFKALGITAIQVHGRRA